MRVAPRITLADELRRELEKLSRGRSVEVRLVERAKIVLLAADGLDNETIAERLGISRQKAGRWRTRFAIGGLAAIEKDAPRPGRFPTISAKLKKRVVEMTLHETPPGATHWSRSSMAKAVGISDSTVGRIWRERGLKPHLVSTFKIANDKQFVEKTEDIVGGLLPLVRCEWYGGCGRRVNAAMSSSCEPRCGSRAGSAPDVARAVAHCPGEAPAAPFSAIEETSG